MKMVLTFFGAIALAYNLVWLFKYFSLQKQLKQFPEDLLVQKSLKRGNQISRISLAIVSIVYLLHVLEGKGLL